MHDPLRIEKIGLASIDEAFGLLKRFFAEEGFATPPEQMRSSLQVMLINESSAVFLARAGEEALGVATVTISVGLEYGLSAELEDLYVLPLARRRGIAGALIEEVCAWCKRQGCTAVLVTVTPQGEKSHELHRFYHGHAFGDTGRLILERKLNEADDVG
jgi:aminoglycoside 6'-N-acetyltransferase I